MFCFKCGKEISDNSSFCVRCGAMVDISDYREQLSPLKSMRLTALTKDPLFLALGIFYCVSAVVSIFYVSLNIINILLCIFTLLAYTRAISNNPYRGMLRCISGTMLAMYIISIVATFLMALFLLLLCTGGFEEIFSHPAWKYYWELSGYSGTIPTISEGTKIWFYIIFAVLLIYLGLYTFFGVRNFHKLAKFTYTGGIESDTKPSNLAAVKFWLVFPALLDCVAVILAKGQGIVIVLFNIAICTVGFLLVRKHYS